eukprot:Hpha_TRINITY_DN15784_c1_g9::TRINITY_DN15784_c1_g9_i1::g.37865::m.37865
MLQRINTSKEGRGEGNTPYPPQSDHTPIPVESPATPLPPGFPTLPPNDIASVGGKRDGPRGMWRSPEDTKTNKLKWSGKKRREGTHEKKKETAKDGGSSGSSGRYTRKK